MRPRFRFFYAALAAVATYGLLFSLNAPRMWGGHGPHQWDRQRAGCAGDSVR